MFSIKEIYQQIPYHSSGFQILVNLCHSLRQFITFNNDRPYVRHLYVTTATGAVVYNLLQLPV